MKELETESKKDQDAMNKNFAEKVSLGIECLQTDWIIGISTS